MLQISIEVVAGRANFAADPASSLTCLAFRPATPVPTGRIVRILPHGRFPIVHLSALASRGIPPPYYPHKAT